MKHIALLLLLIAAVVGVAFLSLPDDPGEAPAMVFEPIESDGQRAVRQARIEAIETERDARLAVMKDEYEKLERERRRLRVRLRDVTYYLGYADLEPEQRSEIMDDIGKANRLLINPPLLGAFRGIDGIREELARFDRTNERLDEIEAIIKAHSDKEWG